MKTIVVESLLVVASVLLWLAVIPIATMLSPVLALAEQRSPKRSLRPRVRLTPSWRMVETRAI